MGRALIENRHGLVAQAQEPASTKVVIMIVVGVTSGKAAFGGGKNARQRGAHCASPPDLISMSDKSLGTAMIAVQIYATRHQTPDDGNLGAIGRTDQRPRIGRNDRLPRIRNRHPGCFEDVRAAEGAIVRLVGAMLLDRPEHSALWRARRFLPGPPSDASIAIRSQRRDVEDHWRLRGTWPPNDQL